MIALTPDPLDPAALVAAVADPDHGGTATFLGTTRREGGLREVAELRYEAYEELAYAEPRRASAPGSRSRTASARWPWATPASPWRPRPATARRRSPPAATPSTS